MESKTSSLIEYFPPLEDSNIHTKIGMLIFAGGSYRKRVDHECYEYASYFREHGIHCFVVNYRLGPQHRHPTMINDALSAMSQAQDLCRRKGIDIKKFGVIGSSAGGHLALHLATQKTVKLDFTILCYPVVHMQGEFAHLKSRGFLLGENPSQKQIEEVSLLNHLHKNMSPLFIMHTKPDEKVPVQNSIDLSQRLHSIGVANQLMIIEKGLHGLGLNTDPAWADEAIHWLKNL